MSKFKSEIATNETQLRVEGTLQDPVLGLVPNWPAKEVKVVVVFHPDVTKIAQYTIVADIRRNRTWRTCEPKAHQQRVLSSNAPASLPTSSAIWDRERSTGAHTFFFNHLGE